jgi:acetyl-CoA carboxylase biotin carboxyl carrier protein
MAKNEFDEDLIRRLAAVLDDTGLTEIELEADDLRVRISRQAAAASAVAAPPPAAPAPAPSTAAVPDPTKPVDSTDPSAITSPMVGVAYLREEPGAPQYVEIGATVREGQTLCLIEAMKTFNPLRSPRSGTVTRILVGDQSPVEYGEVLMTVE